MLALGGNVGRDCAFPPGTNVAAAARRLIAHLARMAANVGASRPSLENRKRRCPAVRRAPAGSERSTTYILAHPPGGLTGRIFGPKKEKEKYLAAC